VTVQDQILKILKKHRVWLNVRKIAQHMTGIRKSKAEDYREWEELFRVTNGVRYHIEKLVTSELIESQWKRNCIYYKIAIQRVK